MPAISSREWLYELADRSDLVKRFLKIHNTPFASDQGRPPPDVLEPSVLVGLISVLVEQNAATEKAYQRYMEVHFNPTIVVNSEWHTIERSVIQSSDSIRFQDFLKSFW